MRFRFVEIEIFVSETEHGLGFRQNELFHITLSGPSKRTEHRYMANRPSSHKVGVKFHVWEAPVQAVLVLEQMRVLMRYDDL
jgi:hypothetical protein